MIRRYRDSDWPEVWALLEPVFRDGTTYAIESDIEEEAARRYWVDPPKQTFVFEEPEGIAATYYLAPNQRGPGSHVANCGYVTGAKFRGRGLASALCAHSLQEARSQGFRSMQFNLVVSTNLGAIRLWKRLGFQEVGTLPEAFCHPREGYVDALVLSRSLASLEVPRKDSP